MGPLDDLESDDLASAFASAIPGKFSGRQDCHMQLSLESWYRAAFARIRFVSDLSLPFDIQDRFLAF